MKKIVTLLLLFFALIQFSFAQNNTFRFGAQTSPSINWVRSDDKNNDSDGTNLGFRLGMLAEYYLDSQQRYAFTTGLGLAFNQGGALKYKNLGGAGTLFPDSELSVSSLDTLADGTSVRYHIRAVELPVGLKMRTDAVAMGGYMRLYVELPIFTLGINVRSRGDIGNFEDENIKKDVNILNLSWGLGGGVEYAVSESTSIIGGIYYQSGMADFSQDNTADDSKTTLGGITFRLGVLF